MMRSLFTGIALTSVALATSASAPHPTFAAKLGRQVSPAAPSMNAPTYIAQATNSNSPDSLEKAIHNQINKYRTDRGLPPLTLDSRISEQARIHSQNMASGAVPFSHNGFNQRVQEIAKVISYSAAAENVAYNQGYSDPATQAVQGWLNSTGHRTNIEGQYDMTGIGVAKNANGAYYCTQMFIRRR